MKNSAYHFMSQLNRHTNFLLFLLLLAINTLQAQPLPVDKVKADFITLLQRPVVAPEASFTKLITDSAIIEKGYFYSEATEKVPVLLYKPLSAKMKKWPVVVCLHGTGGSKDDAGMKDLLYRFCKAGFIAVSIDGRFHGERANAGAGHNSYVEAIIKAWQNTDSQHQPHPFFFDTVYDLWKLTDYLLTRPDVDTSRIGMMGISKGGIETWMAASVDTRIKVAVPVIATQSFQWSLQNDRWQGRARTIWGAHVQAAKDLGDTGVNKNNVQLFWNKLLPGITGEFDCPSMIRLFAPRPLLLLSTENDQNCPLPGAKIAYSAAADAYSSANAMTMFKTDVEPNQPHRFTERQTKMAIAWFVKWL